MDITKGHWASAGSGLDCRYLDRVKVPLSFRIKLQGCHWSIKTVGMEASLYHGRQVSLSTESLLFLDA